MKSDLLHLTYSDYGQKEVRSRNYALLSLTNDRKEFRSVHQVGIHSARKLFGLSVARVSWYTYLNKFMQMLQLNLLYWCVTNVQFPLREGGYS